jgi:hypothetical protein
MAGLAPAIFVMEYLRLPEICPMTRTRCSPRSRLAARAAIFAASLLTAAGAQAQTPPQAIRLKEIKNLDQLDPDWIMGMCNLPGLECNKVDEPRLFERKTETGTEYYALMVGRTLSRLVMKAPGQWELLNRWSFEAYPVRPAEGGAGDPRMIDIHPALYPAGFGLWAVALLDSRTEGYSGGGAQFVTADFVTLDPEAAEVGEQQRLFRAVPFSCSKTVRACFSPKEHKTSPHCQDETSGFLTLKFATTTASRFHEWTATWHQTSWPAGVPKTAQTKTQTTSALQSGKQAIAPGTFAFCEGGAADQ